MISITITDLGALSPPERERLADYLRGHVQSKPAEVTAPVDLGNGRGFAVSPEASAIMDTTFAPAVAPAIDTATVFAPQPQVTKPEKDAQGVVWDARIHSSSRNMNKDGTWKRLRGCDDVLFAQVMGELTGTTTRRVEVEAAPVAPPPPADAITTFPQLMTRITAAGIPAPAVIAAVKETGESVGWENATLPMLGTGRTELIPEVARRLGLV